MRLRFLCIWQDIGKHCRIMQGKDMAEDDESMDMILISGIEYKFSMSIKLEFAMWFLENEMGVDAEEISLQCIRSVQENNTSFDAKTLNARIKSKY